MSSPTARSKSRVARLDWGLSGAFSESSELKSGFNCGEAGPGEARRGRAGHGMARQGKARQGNRYDTDDDTRPSNVS